MVSLTFLIASLVVCYYSQRELSKAFSWIITRIGGGRKAIIVIWSIIFLPGTVIHEMSHLFFAILFGARTGKIEIFPSYIENKTENTGSAKITLGSVQTQKLNPIQGFFIGTAPFIVGLGLLAWISSSIQANYTQTSVLQLFIQGYLFFTISNSFFPSWTDIKQVIPLTVVALSLMIIGYLVGFRMVFPNSIQLSSVMNVISTTAFLGSLLNFLIVLLIFFTRKVFARRH